MTFPLSLITAAQETLEILKASFPSNYENVIENLLALKGKLVVMGVGKSGLIARKFASSLASTGTPAFFLHPTEASHGDLGAIAPDDGIFLFSNSGKSHELLPVLSFAKARNTPVFAITSNPQSQLANNAQTLFIPRVIEYEPLQTLPSASTLLMLALADSLVASLSKRCNVSLEDYKKLHPSGTIGYQLTVVEDVMQTETLPLVETHTPLKEILLTMAAGKYDCVGVLEDKCYAGTLRLKDIKPHLKALETLTARQILPQNFMEGTLSPRMQLPQALEALKKDGVTSALVVAEDRKTVLGIVEQLDLESKP